MNLGTVTESRLVGPDKSSSAASALLPCLCRGFSTEEASSSGGRVWGPRETRLAGQAQLVRGKKPEPVNSRSFWHIVEALDDF